MPRLLFDGEWLEPVSGSSLFEADFERQVIAQASALFPGWHVAPFPVMVVSRDFDVGARKPDFALVHPEYTVWWVVEVELYDHDLNTHVIPQIDVFTLGQYTDTHAEFLAAQLPRVDLVRLRGMIRNVQPGVLVIVNDDAAGWKDALAMRSAKYCVVRPHRDRMGHYGYEVSGFLPSASESFVSKCRRSEWSPRVLQVLNPAALGIGHNEEVSMVAPSGLINCRVLVTGDGSFLMALGPGDPFPVGVREFELHRTSDGQLSIQESRRTAARR